MTARWRRAKNIACSKDDSDSPVLYELPHLCDERTPVFLRLRIWICTKVSPAAGLEEQTGTKAIDGTVIFGVCDLCTSLVGTPTGIAVEAISKIDEFSQRGIIVWQIFGVEVIA